MSRLLRAVVMLWVGFSPFACGDEGISGPGPIEVQELFGDYVATEFIAEVEGAMVDMLAEGSEITLALAADGGTSGQLIIPPPFGEDDAGQVADLTGFFLFDEENATVEFTHPADTFLRDLPFSAVRVVPGGIELRGSGSFAGEIEVVLTRQ